MIMVDRAACPHRTIFLVLLFSQYARNVQLPLPIYQAKKGWTSYRLQLFKMFPVRNPPPASPLSPWTQDTDLRQLNISCTASF